MIPGIAGGRRFHPDSEPAGYRGDLGFALVNRCNPLQALIGNIRAIYATEVPRKSGVQGVPGVPARFPMIGALPATARPGTDAGPGASSGSGAAGPGGRGRAGGHLAATGASPGRNQRIAAVQDGHRRGPGTGPCGLAGPVTGGQGGMAPTARAGAAGRQRADGHIRPTGGAGMPLTWATAPESEEFWTLLYRHLTEAICGSHCTRTPGCNSVTQPICWLAHR
jgi:hypothetical protein